MRVLSARPYILNNKSKEQGVPMDYILVAAGLTFLVVAGDGLVRGAVSMAQHLGVPSLVIGLTVVAFGTSAPELIVGVDGVLKGVPELTLGNVVGSNIANILLVVGLPAIILPMRCAAPGLVRNLLYMLGATLVVITLGCFGEISAIYGLLLLFLLGWFVFDSLMRARRSPLMSSEALEDLEGLPVKPYSWPVTITLIIVGLSGLALGAHWLIDGSVNIARRIGVPESFIGLTLVALGTSLPELATAIIAALKRHGDVAVGNVVGSNVFNILGIIGTSSLFGRIPVNDNFINFDFWVMFGSSLILLPYALRKATIGRIFGIILVALYISYIIYLGYDVSIGPDQGLPV
jgi:cation:H+ antiporter